MTRRIKPWAIYPGVMFGFSLPDGWHVSVFPCGHPHENRETRKIVSSLLAAMRPIAVAHGVTPHPHPAGGPGFHGPLAGVLALPLLERFKRTVASVPSTMQVGWSPRVVVYGTPVFGVGVPRAEFEGSDDRPTLEAVAAVDSGVSPTEIIRRYHAELAVLRARRLEDIMRGRP